MEIQLTHNKITVVDPEDFDYLNQWKWKYHKDGYAYRNTRSGSVYMHRLILNTPKEKLTDHINGDKLDNRKNNLRIVNDRENSLNRKLAINNKSGTKGVSWNVRYNKWEATIGVNYKNIHLGLYDNINDAQSARIKAEIIYGFI